MPLEHGSSRSAFEHNLKTEMAAGKPQSQALAIAYRTTGRDEVPKAAGVICRAPDGRVLFLQRGEGGDHPGEWCLPGGGAEDGEDAEQTARRELAEETGYHTDGELKPFDKSANDQLEFSTFVHDAPEAFAPELNDEHVDWMWADPASPPEPLHPGVEATLAGDAERSAKEASEGRLTAQEREEATRGENDRKDMPAEAFLEPGERKYPVKVKRDGAWAWSRDLLLAAAREARMHGHEELASKADAIREKEFGGAQDAAPGREQLALDRSVRSYDRDGRLRVEVANISKANVCPYLGREIPGWEDLGLDPDKTYQLLRDPEELKKAAATSNGVPLLVIHKPVNADEPQKELIAGTVGTNAEFNDPYLQNALVFWDGGAIKDVESNKKKELSSGYHYRPDMTPGTFNGVPYDGVMRDIEFNHVATVVEGRAGTDVVVGDSKEQLNMTKPVLTRKAAMTQGALAAFLRPRLAQDAQIDLMPIVKGLGPKNFADRKAGILTAVKAATKGKLAQDADIDDLTNLLDALQREEVTEVGDAEEPNAAIPVKEEPEGKDAGSEALKEHLKGKLSDEDYAKAMELMGGGAEDEETEEERKKREAEAAAASAKDRRRGARDAEPELKPEVTKAAMDAAIRSAVATARDEALKNQREVREAEKAVRPYVGELAIAQDSAEGVYRTALKMMNVDGAETIHASALPAILKLQPLPSRRERERERASIAQDAAGAKSFAERFPGADRIAVL